MTILETERLILRELEAARDGSFIHELLNSPKFIQYIGDRGVRSESDAATFIDERYRSSYAEHGYGLWAVDRKEDGASVGMCGFVRRDTLPGPDIGFAFLPQFERMGYGYESAAATIEYGRGKLGFDQVLAITSMDNDASGKLLEKLGLRYKETIDNGSGESVKLYSLV